MEGGEELECYSRSAVLTNPYMLEHIISFLETSYLFVAPVHSTFRDCFAALFGPSGSVSSGAGYRTSLASACHSVATVRFARSEGLPWDLFAWLRENNGPLSLEYQKFHSTSFLSKGQAGYFLGRYGGIEALAFALRHGCPLLASACAGAAEAGDKKTLVWLRNQNIPWDRDTVALSARNGHIDAMAYALDSGCSWRRREKRNPREPPDLSLSDIASKPGNGKVLRWLLENGYPVG